MSPSEIKLFRKHLLKLSQHQFGYIFGVHLVTVSNWESGKTAPVSMLNELFIYIKHNGRYMFVEDVLIRHGRIEALKYLIGSSMIPYSRAG